MEDCGPCPVFASFILAFALQLRKKDGKTSVRLKNTSVRVQYTYYQNTHALQNPHKNTHTYTNTHTHTHTNLSLYIVHTSPGVHPASHSMATESSFTAEERPQSQVEDKNEWRYAPSPPIRLLGVYRDSCTCAFTFRVNFVLLADDQKQQTAAKTRKSPISTLRT